MSETTPDLGSTPTPQEGAGLLDELFGRKRALAFGLVFALALALFILAMIVPADPDIRQTLTQAANSTLPSPSDSPPQLVVVIFANNMRVAALESIPGFGFLFLPLSIYTSGVIIQGLAVSSSVSPVAVTVFYLLFPFTVVELFAYAVALVSGTMLIVAWRGKRLRREVRVFVLELAAIAVVLAVAATMETITIISLEVGLLLWIPLVAVVVPLVLRVRRSRK